MMPHQGLVSTCVELETGLRSSLLTTWLCPGGVNLEVRFVNRTHHAMTGCAPSFQILLQIRRAGRVDHRLGCLFSLTGITLLHTRTVHTTGDTRDAV